MIVLISTDQQLVIEVASVPATAAPNLDVIASYNDLGMPNLTLPQPGMHSENISRGGRFPFGGPPPDDYVRQYKSIYIYNRHATNSVAVTFLFQEGAGLFVVKKYTLATLEHASYIEGVGFKRYLTSGEEVAPV